MGTYTVVALYKGDNNYSPVNASVTVEVKAVPKLNVAADVAGDDLVVNVACVDDLAYRVNVTVGDQSKLLRLKDGKGTLRFSGLAAGNYTVVALYKGDGNYLQASSDIDVEIE